MAKLEGRERRKLRVRKKVSGTPQRPRLTVFRSNKQMSAQVVDDTSGSTLASATSLTLTIADDANKTVVAAQVGEAIAEACKAKGITTVVFDRNGYIYHGRVKALADGARKGGLLF